MKDERPSWQVFFICYVTSMQFYEKLDNVEVFKPKLTRPICSVYEFCRLVTDLANHLSNLPSLERYVEELEINNIIEPCDLAFRLLKSGKFDAILDRGYEKVTFSELSVDPNIYALVESYLSQQESRRREAILEKIHLLS